MKKILLIFFLGQNTLSYSQNKNFSIVDNLIVWKYVYEDSLSVKNLMNNPRLEFRNDSTGIIKKTNFENKKLNQLTGDFKIESKKGKYRVNVFNLKFHVDPVGLSSSKISMQTISEYTIEKSILKKDGTIREKSLGYNLTETLNPHLIDLFKIKNKPNTDW